MQAGHGDDWGQQRYRMQRVRFAPYGISGWAGSRRLEFWQRSGPDPDRVDQLWLAHDDRVTRTRLVIGTFDPENRVGDADQIAEDVAIKLLNIGLPDPELPRPQGFGTRLLRHAEHLAAAHDQWSSMPATVDDNTVLLRYVSFAGCWAATIDDYPIGIYSTSERPHGFVLTRLHDTTPYGFDHAKGVRFVDMHGPESWSSREGWHPDHYALL